MLTRPKSLVGLDIGTTMVKAVELTQAGSHFKVTSFGQVEVPPDDQQSRIEAIADLMREGGFKTRRVVTAIGGKSVIIRYLTMPRMSDDELQNAIIFEAEKYIPFPLSECVMDCQRLEEGKGEQMPVLLVAVKREVVDQHLECLQGAGITPEVVDVDAFALGNAHALCRAGDQDGGGGVAAFVDVGASRSNVNIVRDGTSFFTREIGIGGHDFTEALAKRLSVEFDEAERLKREPGQGEEVIKDAAFPVIDDLGNEIQLCFDYFENQYEREIESIQFTGGGALLSCLRESVEKIFERPTQLFNPFETLPIDEGIDPDLLNATSAQLVVALGLAARVKRS